MTDRTNAERQRRYIARLKSQRGVTNVLVQARTRIAELESELKQAQAAPSMSSREKDLRARNIDLETEVISLRRALARAQADAAAAKTPRPPKPPVDPDSEVGRLKTANKELRGKLAHLTRWHEEQMQRSGKMPAATRRAIVKCLHSDHAPDAEERENACKLFNVFIDSQKGK